jgi:hypothetical protein
MDPTDARQELGKALRMALESVGRSQSWLGAEVAHSEGRADPYSQAVVSDWLNGVVDLPPHRLFIIERVLGKKPGSLSRIAGYLPLDARSVVTVPDAIAVDNTLTEEGRHVVLAAYRSAASFARGA